MDTERRNESVAQALDQIAQEVRNCTACALHKGRTHAVPGEGPLNAEIMFIGEAPGRNEDQQGRPFVGPAGKLLEELLAEIGLAREDVWIGNVVKCRPPDNRDPRPEEIAACAGYLQRQIDVLEPKMIATLGPLLNGKVFSGCENHACAWSGSPRRASCIDSAVSSSLYLCVTWLRCRMLCVICTRFRVARSPGCSVARRGTPGH